MYPIIEFDGRDRNWQLVRRDAPVEYAAVSSQVAAEDAMRHENERSAAVDDKRSVQMKPDELTYITSESELRARHHAPMSRATDKVLDHIDKHCRSVIELAPFCVISTQGENGADVSPRGDPPGFVKVLDEKTVLVPDRVGNNRLDAMSNLLVNPHIGILFMVPGMGETLRINGTGRVTDDARALKACAVQGRAPKVGIVVRVREAFLHCPKAFVRSGLWDPANHINRSILPSYTDMLLDHVNGLTLAENERQTEVMTKRGLY